MKKTIIVLLALCLTVFAFAQEKTYRHNIALDLGGPATIAQMEYQYDFIAKEKHHLGVSVGVGPFLGATGFPLGIQYRLGKKHQIETGIHYTYLVSAVTTGSIVSVRLGYRLNLRKMFIHVYGAPMVGGQAWAGLGFGLKL